MFLPNFAVTKYFLGNNNSLDYKMLLEDMLQKFQNLGCFIFALGTTPGKALVL
jgi:hypothetical protein